MTTSATPAADGRARATCAALTCRRCFTLMELMLVLSIIALAAALAIPRLAPTARRLGTRSANYELLWLLRQARWWSVSSGQTCLVHLSPTAGGYTAEVTRREAEDQPAEPLGLEWARLEQLPAVKKLMQIPPDSGATRRTELTVRFTPWGVTEDYVIALAPAAGQAAMRIEVRRPSGLVWLLSEDRPSAFDPEALADIDAYWATHCRDIGQ